MTNTGFRNINDISSAASSAFHSYNHTNTSNDVNSSLLRNGDNHDYYGVDNVGMELQQQVHVANPKWLHNLSKVFVYQDEQQRKLEQLERVSFRVGDTVKVKKTGKMGTIITEKSGGWRVIRFSDKSSAAFRPSALIEIKSHEAHEAHEAHQMNQKSNVYSTTAFTEDSGATHQVTNTAGSNDDIKGSVTTTTTIINTDDSATGSKESSDNVSESLTTSTTSINKNTDIVCNDYTSREEEDADDGCCDFMIGMDALDHFYNPAAASTRTNTLANHNDHRNTNICSDTNSIIYSEVSETTEDQDRSLSLSHGNSSHMNSSSSSGTKNANSGFNHHSYQLNSTSCNIKSATSVPTTTIGSTTTVTLTFSSKDSNGPNNNNGDSGDISTTGDNLHDSGSNRNNYINRNRKKDTNEVPNYVYIQ
jgi:hypothetical protein